MGETMTEDLTKALDCAKFVVRDLAAATAKADPVEAIVLQALIADAADLIQGIAALQEAISAKQ